MGTPGLQVHQGSIVWVVPDQTRGGSKKRPAVILTGNGEIPTAKLLVAVAVTTDFPNPIPNSYVELPWDPRGHRKTSLRRRSAAVCDWLIAVQKNQIESVEGIIPDTSLLAILQKVKG